MAFNTSENRLKLIRAFPALANDANFKLLSPATPCYNCIAWAMGYIDRWVDTDDKVGHWWPTGVEKSLKPAALIQAFEAVGYIEADDYKPEDNYHKVILYKNIEKDIWTHASLVVTAFVEHSKFGSAWDGEHSHNVLNSTTPDSYGVPYAYMKRPQRRPLPEREISGKIIIDEEAFIKFFTNFKS